MRLERAHITWSELRVGLFVVLAVAVLMAMLIYVSGTDIFSNSITLESYVPNAKGLSKGDPVLLAGIRVGAIKTIGIGGSSFSAPVHIVFTVSQDVALHIHQDAQVELHGAGLTPTQHIEISPGSNNMPIVESGTVLPGHEAAGFDSLLTTLGDTVSELQKTLTQSTQLITALNQGKGTLGSLLQDSSLYEDLQIAASHTSDVLGKANGTEGTLAQLLTSQEMADDLSRALTATRTFLEQLTAPEGTLAHLTQEDAIYQEARMALSEWKTLAASLDSSMQHVDSLLEILQPAVHQATQGDGSVARLLNDPTLHDQLVETASETSELLRTVHHGDGLVSKALRDPELAAHVTQSVKATSEIAQKLNTPGGTLDRLSTDTTLYEQLVTMLGGLNEVVNQVQQKDGTAGMLLRDEQFPKEFRQFIQDFQTLVHDIQAHPERYVHLSLF